MAPRAAVHVRRHPAGDSRQPWISALVAPGMTLEVVAAEAPFTEDAILDGLEALLESRPSWWAWLPGSHDEVGYLAEVAAGARIAVEAVAGGLIAGPAPLGSLRGLVEEAGAPARRVLLVGGGDDPQVRDALRSGAAAAACARAGIAAAHVSGTDWAALIHDPARSGLGLPPADAARLPLPGSRRRATLLPLAGVAAVAAAAVVAAVALGVSNGDVRQGTNPGAVTPAAGRPAEATGLAAPLRPGPAPSTRQAPAAMVDPSTGMTVVFGGISPDGAGTDLADTWVLSGGRWRAVETSPHPTAAHGALLAPDPSAPGTALLIGGSRAGGGALVAQAWRFDEATSSWSPLPAGSYPGGEALVMAADLRARDVVAVTRLPGPNGMRVTHTWRAGTWTDSPLPTPDLRLIAGDAALGVIGLSSQPGGFAGPAQSWRWTGVDWQRIDPPREPFVDGLTATLTAAPTGGLVLAEVAFIGSAGDAGGTWAFDGATWVHQPGPVPDFLRAFDAVSPVWGVSGGDLVLVGGPPGAEAYRRGARWHDHSWTGYP